MIHLRTAILLFCLGIGGLIGEGTELAGAAEPANLAALIQAAIREGRSECRVAPGTYRLDEPIMLRKVRHFTIDGTGARIIRTQPANVFTINACDGVTVRGFTIDYDPVPFTQGTVTAVDAQSNIEFEIHEGYPGLGPETRYHVVYVFDPRTRHWKRGVADLYGKMEIIDARHGRYNPGVSTGAPVEVGDLISINPRRSNTFWLGEGSSRVTLENLTIQSCPGAAILGRFAGEKHRIRNVIIERGPRPPGASQDRLLSTNADAVNYGISRSSLVLEDCNFGFMGDDSLNIHGPVFPIVKVESPTSLLVVRPWSRQKFELVMKSGDVLRVLTPDTFAPAGEAIFDSIAMVKEHGLERGYLFKFLPKFKSRNENAPHTVYRITLKQPAELAVGMSLDHPASLGSGYVVRNNYFHDQRPRGLRLQAPDGLVENNRFERIPTAAITIGAEYSNWGEAGWAGNVIVRNNTLIDVGTGNVLSGSNKVPAAICVFGSSGGPRDHFPQGHRNILIENNRIERAAPAAIYIYAARDVIIRGNTVIDSGVPDMNRAGADLGLGPRRVIDIHLDAAGVVEGNTIRPEPKP